MDPLWKEYPEPEQFLKGGSLVEQDDPHRPLQKKTGRTERAAFRTGRNTEEKRYKRRAIGSNSQPALPLKKIYCFLSCVRWLLEKQN